ncbi:MAG: hypothetical protein QNK37_11315 [Acidobacteriota bacterium]|nr:hypothetical protein [Acidobacteriota bacterium]
MWIKDHDLPWDGPFPYEHLDRRTREHGFSGIDPEASARAVKDLLFDLMSGGRPSHEDRSAWDQLRDPRRRLAIDFLMYELTDKFARFPNVFEDLEMPVALPDFRELLKLEPVLASLEPDSSPQGTTDPPPRMEVAARTPSPADVGPIDIEESVIWRDYD